MKKPFNFRKLICLLLVLVTAFVFAACNNSPDNGGAGGGSGSTITDGDNSGGSSGGGSEAHEHKYVLVKSVKATCTEAGRSYYYSCECGKIFKRVSSEYVETSADDLYIAPLGHSYTAETVKEEYLVSEATADSPRVYTKTCVRCGLKSDNAADTFTYGETLTYYESVDKTLYTPYNLTVGLFDAANCVYGFTWNTDGEPVRPVIKVKNLSDNQEITVHADYALSDSKSYKNNAALSFYSCKAEVALTPGDKYEYTVSDMYVGVNMATVEITAVNPKTTGAFKFVHASDSQSAGSTSDGGAGTGTPFQRVLKNVVEQGDVDFMIHTGDVVEYSVYQSYWNNMLGENFAYLSKLPVMAISGNHETTYRNGSNETFERFNYNIPEQDTELGFYYSFSYGNVKFIMLNTNRLGSNNGLTSDQYDWLEKELEEKTEKWTIVSMHNPMYSVGKWGSDKSRNGIALALAKQLKGLFARYKVDLVLQGHDHMYSATYPLGENGEPTGVTVGEDGYYTDPNGVIYVMNGPAGNQSKGSGDLFMDDNNRNLYYYGTASQQSSWAEFLVDGDKITVTLKSAASGTAQTIRTWGIKKTA